jgi:alcohol dehydrogenase
LKAVYFDAFGVRPVLTSLPDPEPTPTGVVIEVQASGLCRSDWHGWMGHDADIRLPHVPGHELAGTIAAVGRRVSRWRVGERVTMPFAAGCGICEECARGQQQVCRSQFQPGFTGWGSFAQFVAVDFADVNLVRIPETIDFATAAGLGCRFATSFRAVVDQGHVSAGEWLVVHGCGGVGLSAVMMAAAIGARVVAIDVNPEKLELAKSVGAEIVILAEGDVEVPQIVRDVTGGGAHVSVDALGSHATCWNSISCLRRQGRHVQIGLMLGSQSNPPIPMGLVIAYELKLSGSHGMQAHRYGAMLDMILTRKLEPSKLLGHRILLGDAPDALAAMDQFLGAGITMITDFR